MSTLAGRKSRPTATRDAWLRHGVAVSLLGLAAALPLLRQTGTPSWNTIWAEDGAIYFQQAHDSGGLSVLFRGYAGYLQLPPRLLGAFSVLLPVDQLPRYFSFCGVVVSALLAWFVWSASEGWIDSRPVRLALASLVVLMPALGGENTANITDLGWVFAAALPWAFIATSAHGWRVFVRCVVAFTAATATTVAALFLPFGLAVVLIRRTRNALVVGVAFCLGLTVQITVVLTTHDTATVLTRNFGRLAGLTSARVFAEYLLGDKGIGALWSTHRLLLIVGAPLLVATVFAALFPGVGRRRQLLAGAFLSYAVVIFVIPVWIRGTNAIQLSSGEAPRALYALPLGGVLSTRGSYIAGELRYSVVPVMMLASAAAVLAAAPERRTRNGRMIRSLFVAHVVVLTAVGFSVKNTRSGDPAWSTSLRRAYQSQCLGAAPDTRVTVRRETGPLTLFPVALRCRDLPH